MDLDLNLDLDLELDWALLDLGIREAQRHVQVVRNIERTEAHSNTMTKHELTV